MTDFVEVKASAKHGLGLFAKIDIERGQRIAIYQVIARPASEIDEIYGVILPTTTEESFDYILAGVPIKDTSRFVDYEGHILRNLAMFINEPSPEETSNVDILMNRIENLVRRGQERAKINDVFTYYFYTLRDIKAGEEILWYYGENYHRDYPVSKR